MAPPFDAELLACALVITGKTTPTPNELSAALVELYSKGGPTVADVLAAGWLVPTTDGHRLRLPPPPVSELWQRLTADSNSVNSTELTSNRATPPAGTPSEDTQLNRHPMALSDQFKDELVAGTNALPNVEARSCHFSFYRGGIAATLPYAAITPAQLYDVLTSPRYKGRTESLRAAAVGSPERDAIKRSLDYVTPAGTFTRRGNNGLTKASGLLVLDFDHVPDVSAARAALLTDALLAPELVLLFTSPSGDGLKALVKADPAAAHLDNFRAYAAYLAGYYTPLGLRPDEAGKDVARACFVPYAPDAWLAPAYATAS